MDIKVIDKFSIINDPKMPFLQEILSPLKVETEFKKYFPFLLNKYELNQIKVIRYKAERRCLIEYIWQGENTLNLIAKIRAKGTDINSYNLQKKLWNNGFNDNSVDQISVPEPIGMIPKWQMWLQRKVEGEVASHLFSNPQNIKLIPKIAHVAHKLHQSQIPTNRCHTMADELHILQQKLPLLIANYPDWEQRINNLLKKCYQLGEKTPESQLCGIHRDFYQEQIIINKEHFYLLDLDLYCQGNPSLDLGNFIAHISEYSLRMFGNFQALQTQENLLQEEFIKLAGENNRSAITAYQVLTLVRHIYLSTQFPERCFYTKDLFDLCEDKLESLLMT